MVTEKYHNEIKHLGLIYNDFEMDKGYGVWLRYGYGIRIWLRDILMKAKFLIKLKQLKKHRRLISLPLFEGVF